MSAMQMNKTNINSVKLANSCFEAQSPSNTVRNSAAELMSAPRHGRVRAAHYNRFFNVAQLLQQQRMNNKTTAVPHLRAPDAGLQFLDKIVLCSNASTRSATAEAKWPGLVFLQKKGKSQTKPNFNFINYNFPYCCSTTLKQNGAAAEELILRLSAPKYNINKILIENIYKLLVIFFKSMYCLISKPVFIFTQDTIKIQLFYFACIATAEHLRLAAKSNAAAFAAAGVDLLRHAAAAGTGSAGAALLQSSNKISARRAAASAAANYIFSDLTKVYPNKFKLISGILNKFFNKKVEFELIRLHKPYLDSNILVNFLSLIINRRDISKSIKKIFTSRSMNNFTAKANSTTLKRSGLTHNRENVHDAAAPKIIKVFIDNLRNNFIKKVPLPRSGSVINSFNAVNTAVALKRANCLSEGSMPSFNLNLVQCPKSVALNNWFGFATADKFNQHRINPITEAYLTGINIKISGRLRREPIIPKVTTKKFEKGFTAKGKINYSQMARFTHKNRKGAFSITIKSGQNF